MRPMQTSALSQPEAKALRTSMIGHDVNYLTNVCECGLRVVPDTPEHTEHLLECAFRAGEVYAIMQE